MYEENNENLIDWKNVAKKAAIVIVAILIVVGSISMITKCSNKSNGKKDKTPEIEIDLTKQLDELETATLNYLTKDNLPTELNSSKTIRLKILENKGLIKNLSDSQNNVCDTNASYSEVTKLENSYAIKLSVTCGGKDSYRIIYAGCFKECNGGICKGTEASTNGSCTNTENENKDINDNKNNASNNNPSNSNNNVNKPSNSTTQTKPSTNNNSQSSNNSNNSNTKKTTYYEYKKEIKQLVCTKGTLNKNSVCENLEPQTVYGKVITVGGATTTNYVGNPLPVSRVTKANNNKITTTTPGNIKNNYNTMYLYNGYANGVYIYDKYSCTNGTISKIGNEYKCTYTTNECSVGTKQGNSCVTYTNLPAEKTCEDRTFTYHSDIRSCTKVENRTVYYPPKSVSTYEYKWSTSKSLQGWTRTGKTKIE